MSEQNPDDLGREVRAAWIEWAKTQPNPKPSWLVPYDELSEADREADRLIGVAIAVLVQEGRVTQAEAENRRLEKMLADVQAEDERRRVRDLQDLEDWKSIRAELATTQARLESAHALLRDTWEISEFWFYVPKALQERYRVTLESAAGERSEE